MLKNQLHTSQWVEEWIPYPLAPDRDETGRSCSIVMEFERVSERTFREVRCDLGW